VVSRRGESLSLTAASIVTPEYTCLQDLISCAVHVQNEAVVSGLRKVLRYIHEQKKQKGVRTVSR
jgi:hypothetical protein